MDWDGYASAVNAMAPRRGETRLTGQDIRRYVEWNRKRLQNMGLSFPHLPRRIDKERFAKLYREHGRDWTWAQYAKELSRLQGFTGKDELSATSISAYVSRNRDDLAAIPRRTDARDHFPWPALNLKAYKQQTYWRYLLLYLRVLDYGEEALKASSPQQYRRYLATSKRLQKERKVVRYDPDRGFYISPAYPDELTQARVFELGHHYYERHPEEASKRRAKDL